MTKYIDPSDNEFLEKVIDGEITPTKQLNTEDVEHGFVIPSQLGVGENNSADDDSIFDTTPDKTIYPREADPMVAFTLGYHCGATEYHNGTQTINGEPLFPDGFEIPSVEKDDFTDDS